jgi:Uma2 family endonuclease
VIAGEHLKLVAAEDYLAGELTSDQKHEFLGGVLYAMAGASNAHNMIATNVLVALSNLLRGQKCRAFNSDTKIRVRLPGHLRFYYPDVSVVRRPNPQSDSFQDEPVLLLEVLSRQTRRLDQGEKKDAYFSIPSLCLYLLVEQESAAVTVYRRTEQGFVRELATGSSIQLSELGIELPLAELYAGVELTVEDEGAG